VFQLIYQVSGRSGRREKQGKAIIQSQNINDIFIQTASKLDTQKFYNISLAQRRELFYPPFSRIARLLFTGKNKLAVQKRADEVSHILKQFSHGEILGPSAAPIEKVKERWRHHLIIKTERKNWTKFHQFLHQRVGLNIFEREVSGVRIQIDIDPTTML